MLKIAHHPIYHDSEYFFDLQNITLNQKKTRKTGISLSEVLIEREMINADDSIKAILNWKHSYVKPEKVLKKGWDVKKLP